MAYQLLLDLGMIIVLGTVFAAIARLLKQPLLLGYLVAGILIGPVGLKLVTSYADISILSELGIAFLLFVIGIETDLHKLAKQKWTIIFGGLVQIFATAFLVFALTQWLGLTFIQSFYIGLMFAFSSTVVVVRLLSSMNQISTLHGRLMIGFLLVQDVIAIIMLPLLAQTGMGSALSPALNFLTGIIAMFALAVIMNKIVLPRILRRFSSSPELFFLIIVSVVFFFIYISSLLNFSIAVGAFIGGLTLASLPYNVEAVSKIRALRDFFSTIFFVSLGMQIQFALNFSIPLLVMLLGIVYILNPIIFFVITLLSGYGTRIALLVGLGLSQASEFSLILAGQGLRLGQLSPEIYSMSIIIITLSMATTPYFIEGGDSVYSFFRGFARKFIPKKIYARLESELRALERLPLEKELKNHIIVLGSGVLGSRIAKSLHKKHTVIVVDHNPRVVSANITHRMNAIYGEAGNPEIWNRLGLEKARLLVVTIPDSVATLKLLRLAKSGNKKIVVFCRARLYEDALKLYEEGADFVVMPEVIGSNVFLHNVLSYLESDNRESFEDLRKEQIEFLREKVHEYEGLE
ncbi:MAG: cation:proton antiporter [archaeon]